MAEHKHGSMDISTQEKTFAGFVRWLTYNAAAIIVVLILLAMING